MAKKLNAYSATHEKNGVVFHCAIINRIIEFYRIDADRSIFGWKAYLEYPDVKGLVDHLLAKSIKAYEDGLERPSPLPTNIPGKPDLQWNETIYLPKLHFISQDDHYTESRNSFLAALDAPLLSIFSSRNSINVHLYNKLQTNLKLRRGLVDLYRKHPWFGTMCSPTSLMDYLIGKDGPTFLNRNPDLVILDAVQEWVCGHYDPNLKTWPITQSAIRALTGRSLKIKTEDLCFLSCLPPSWLPKVTKSEYLVEILSLSRLIDTQLASKPEDIATLLAGTKGDLEEFCRMLALAGGVRGILDFVIAFDINVLEPLFDIGDLTRIDKIVLKSRPHIVSRLLGCKSISKFHKMSVEWHRRESEIRHLQEYGRELSWLPLTMPISRKKGDLQLMFLTTGPDLHEEGLAGFDRNGVQGLNHCVASKSPLCARGETHIGAIRRLWKDGSFERVSTFEVKVDIYGKIELIQHKGRANRKPEPAAEDLLQNWFDLVAGGKLELNEEAIKLRDIPRLKRQDAASALTAWSDFLQRNYRWVDPVEIALEILQIVEDTKRNDVDLSPELKLEEAAYSAMSY